MIVNPLVPRSARCQCVAPLPLIQPMMAARGQSVQLLTVSRNRIVALLSSFRVRSEIRG
jgi:hypothetical protein